MPAMTARALTIAGSDSGGGAGIQGDLKTFTVLGVYGMSAISALTAQNTCGVSAIYSVPADFVRQQIDAVLGDIGADAVKTGMLPTAEVIAVVARALRDHDVRSLVVDPVMVAQSGAALMEAGAREAMLRELVPLAGLITPNIFEAEMLTERSIKTVADMRQAARAMIQRGAAACLLKGGHLNDVDAVDVFDDGRETRELVAPRIETRHTHGTGCQLSAAITAFLASGRSLPDAVEAGKRFITRAIRYGLAIGHGAGPANPMAWKTNPESGTPNTD
jgi:hydroxymethylpyrimidine/phosphomethylpyrimidine kinase